MGVVASGSGTRGQGGGDARSSHVHSPYHNLPLDPSPLLLLGLPLFSPARLAPAGRADTARAFDARGRCHFVDITR